MWFASNLYERGVITGEQFAKAVCEQLARRPVLGELAIRERKLTAEQALQILAAQTENLHKPFGELAVEMGFLSRAEVDELLVEQARNTPNVAEILVKTGVFTEAQILDQLGQSRLYLGHSEYLSPSMVGCD